MEEKVLTGALECARIILSEFQQIEISCISRQFRPLLPFQEITNCTTHQVIDIFAQNIPLLAIYCKKFPSNPGLIKIFIQQFKKVCKTNNFDTILASILDFESILDDIESTEVKKEPNLKEKSLSVKYNQFVETTYIPFLKAFKPTFQQDFGIIFTPDFVIKFILDSIHVLLQKRFDNSSGLSSKDYIFYDPASGALGFEIGLNEFLVSSLKSHSMAYSEWKLYGNEINPASYVFGKFMLSHFLHTLPNTFPPIPMEILFRSALSDHFYSLLSQKAEFANKPLLIVGNPPYAVSSANRGDWISSLMTKYAVKEPNITRLYDDYVKFFRYADWLLEQHGSGMIAFISNRKFLDGKIFYGFRQAMAKTYSEIYIVDLFGDSRNVKGNTSGENIFNIQTGVCISFFILSPDNADPQIALHQEKSENSHIFYTKIVGNQQEIKTTFLSGFSNLQFLKVDLKPPKYLFVPVEIDEKYLNMWQNHGTPLPKVFLHTSRAMISSRDAFMIHQTPTQLSKNIDLLQKREFSQLRNLKRLRKRKDAILENEAILKDFNFRKMQSSILPINYRPFDIRHAITYTINRRCGKSSILDHISTDFIPLHKIALTPPEIKTRILNEGGDRFAYKSLISFNFVQSIQKPPFSHIWVTQGIVDSGLFGYSTSKIAPFHINQEPNLSPSIITKLQTLCPDIQTDEIFGYIYGLLSSPLYASTFQALLVHEYPRIIICDRECHFPTIKSIASLGLELIRLHLGYLSRSLLQQIKTDYLLFTSQITNFKDSPKLLRFRFDNTSESLSLHFCLHNQAEGAVTLQNISKNLWNFNIGSVQILKNWLRAHLYKKMENPWTANEVKQFFAVKHIIGITQKIQTKLDVELKKILNFS